MSNESNHLASIYAAATRLGYRLQKTVSAYAVADHLPAGLPPELKTLWIVCNTGDQVQVRWLGERDPRDLMAANRRAGPESAGPLDDFCRSELVALLGNIPHAVLFPSTRSEPLFLLMPVLRAAGLLRPSPIMNSLHHHYGSWWAVRAVIALQTQATSNRSDELGESPCLQCDAPCADACPGGAVNRVGWDFDACARQRLRVNSSCADCCPARLACPAGAAFQYDDRVLRYHYDTSRESLEAFVAEAPQVTRRYET